MHTTQIKLKHRRPDLSNLHIFVICHWICIDYGRVLFTSNIDLVITSIINLEEPKKKIGNEKS